MKMEPKVYQLSEKEVHMVGDCVGVVWNTRREKRILTLEDGVKYRAEIPVREGEPYIDFFTIRESDGEFYEDDDSPVQGGLDCKFAEQIAEELRAAIEYFKQVASRAQVYRSVNGK